MIVSERAHSAADVQLHYDELDHPYRAVWGEHVHHGYWQTGHETPADAAEALCRLVEARLALEPGMTVCDIGCGYGATAAYLAEQDEVHVTGFTLSGAQAAIARARSPGRGSLTFVERDWLDSGLLDGEFVRAYAIESSEHMVDKARFFSEAHRVLKPGGRLVVCAWLEGPETKPWHVRHLLEPICREGRLPSMGSRADYDALASQAGFTLRSYDDISRNVRRTWSVCARRLAVRLVTDRTIRELALSRATRNRDFLLSIPRLMLALRSGAMRYGVFVWDKAEREPRYPAIHPSGE